MSFKGKLKKVCFTKITAKLRNMSAEQSEKYFIGLLKRNHIKGFNVTYDDEEFKSLCGLNQCFCLARIQSKERAMQKESKNKGNNLEEKK